MIPYEAYKVIHIIGAMFLLFSLGAYLLLSVDKSGNCRRAAAITHGVSVVLILAAGFGLLARLGISGSWPLWVWVKLIVWLTLALIVVLIKRMPSLAPVLWLLIPALGGLAAYMAVYKVDF